MDPVHLRSLGLPLAGSFVGEAERRTPSPPVAAVVPAPKVGDTAVHEGAYVPPPIGAPPPGPPAIDEQSQALAAHLRRSMASRCPARQVSIVSLNMLLKGFDRKFYSPTVGAELRHWPFRKEQLKQLLFGMGADVYCMQEVECLTFSEEFSFLSERDYAAVAPKDDSKGKYPDMAKTAIFYRQDRFEKIWEEHRSRIVLVALRHRESTRLLYVASCHLEGAPGEVATRFTQCKKALESIQRHQKAQKVDPAECAVAFAGDFNETDEGAVCHCLANGGLDRSFRAPGWPDVEITKADFRHDFQLRDLYGRSPALWPSRPPTFCAPPEVTAAWGDEPQFAAVDFLFYSCGALRPLAIREPFSAEQREATVSRGIPSAWHFSDHVPIGGVFEFVSADGALGKDSDAIEVV